MNEPELLAGILIGAGGALLLVLVLWLLRKPLLSAFSRLMSWVGTGWAKSISPDSNAAMRVAELEIGM